MESALMGTRKVLWERMVLGPGSFRWDGQEGSSEKEQLKLRPNWAFRGEQHVDP